MSEERSLPEKVSAIMGVLGTSIYGVSLMDNPVGFVAASVMSLVVDWVLSGAGILGMLILDVWEQLIEAVTGGMGAAVTPFSVAGEVVVDVLDTVDSLAVDLAAGAGPLAPIVSTLVWVAVGVVLVLIVRAAVEVVLWWK